MKAAVMHEVGKPLSIEQVPMPEIGPDEVLIETRSCGICGTDLHILAGHGYVPALPHILGHEPAGVVVEVGKNVHAARAGTRVVPHLFFSCGNCYYCRAGRQQQCAELKGLLGVLSPGAFAEYFKVPAANVFELPDNVPFETGGLLADAVVTAVHAFTRSNLRLGNAAVVLGAGGVGLNLIQILKASGIRVIAVDRAEESLRKAGEMGAEVCVTAGSAEAAERVQDLTDGLGVQCVFNCVGTPQTMRESADYVMRCGRIVVIGEEPGNIPITTTEIAQKELEIVGSRNGTRQDTADAIRLLESGTVTPLIARRFALEQINDAMEAVRRGVAGRVIVVPTP